jgi:hypothetical protein
VSAKTGFGVESAFNQVAKQAIYNEKRRQLSQSNKLIETNQHGGTFISSNRGSFFGEPNGAMDESKQSVDPYAANRFSDNLMLAPTDKKKKKGDAGCSC